MDKIIDLYKINKKGLLCIFVITIIGIIAGSLFYFLLSNNDKILVLDSIGDFFDKVSLGNIDYTMSIKSNLIFNLLYIFIIWFLGVSIIGIPLILILYFFKCFSLGFTIIVIIIKYGFKGCIYSFFYLFPHNIINIFSLAYLSIYAIMCSFRFISSFTKNENIVLKPLINRYKLVLIISILISILSSLYQTFIMPIVLKGVLNI